MCHQCLQLRRQFAQYTFVHRIEGFGGFLIWYDRALSQYKVRFINEFRECLCTFLKAIQSL